MTYLALRALSESMLNQIIRYVWTKEKAREKVSLVAEEK